MLFAIIIASRFWLAKLLTAVSFLSCSCANTSSGGDICAVIMPELVQRLPKDQVDLKVLLVDGQSHNFLFPPSSTTGEITQHIFEKWPSDWEERSSVSKPDNSQLLRFIYRGRFLEPSVKLSSLSLPADKNIVLHMVIRDTIPENPSSGGSTKSKTAMPPESRCCVLL